MQVGKAGPARHLTQKHAVPAPSVGGAARRSASLSPPSAGNHARSACATVSSFKCFTPANNGDKNENRY